MNCKASLLMLDEATSALDEESEKAFQQAVETCAKEQTVLAIAHRLHVVMAADKAVVMASGEVVEFGPPWLLAVSSCIFGALAKGQGLTNDPDEAARHSELSVRRRRTLSSPSPRTTRQWSQSSTSSDTPR